ncbi:hypothetical protein AB4574_25305, partial [Vibrio sp. 10N.222.49.E5]|uniref:hypothetical protein n=1 Tax=Vibrio sp. 10N.222.49.E5 TaxID=3229617 RepID=UPI00354F9CC4
IQEALIQEALTELTLLPHTCKEPKLRLVTQLSNVVELGFSICSKQSFHLKNTSAVFQSYAQVWSSLSHHKSRGRICEFF